MPAKQSPAKQSPGIRAWPSQPLYRYQSIVTKKPWDGQEIFRANRGTFPLEEV
jgi:hypothetical protein